MNTQHTVGTLIAELEKELSSPMGFIDPIEGDCVESSSSCTHSCPCAMPSE